MILLQVLLTYTLANLSHAEYRTIRHRIPDGEEMRPCRVFGRRVRHAWQRVQYDDRRQRLDDILCPIL